MKQLVFSIAILISAHQVLAHHSNAMFEEVETVELAGKVVEFQFTNPHSWIQINVPVEGGELVEWSIEWGSPNNLGRQGIRPSTFPPGAEVVIRTRPMKDGSPGGLFVGARFPDGNIIGRW
ncbi:MAG: hypothetical protein EBS81_01435 [Gammaproteobacteria bacterium]|nr:hypothetical protein [Gammaproteobacteria bacterium]